MKTLYQVLGLPPASTHEQLHAKFKELSVQLHPDLNGGDGERQRELNLAWGTLKNKELRKLYDRKLELAGGQCTKCQGKGLAYVTKSFTQRVEQICGKCHGTGQAQ